MKQFKNWFVLFLLSIMLLNVSLAEAVITVHIKMHVSFGRVSKNCKGFGICFEGITETISYDRQVIMNAADGLWSMDIPLSIVKEFPEQFNEKQFIVEEDYIFPEEFSKYASLKEPLIIKKGEYRMERLENIYRVYFYD